MLSTNSGHYILTKDGVISKLDTYWDRLRDITHQLDLLAGVMQKKLVNSFISTFLFLIVIFWLRPDFNLTIVLLLLVALGAVSLAAMQWATFLEFLNLKKKGLILYRELSRELEWSRTQAYVEEVSVEERILLNNFLLATEMPLHPLFHGFLLLLLPLGSIGLFFYYYFINR